MCLRKGCGHCLSVAFLLLNLVLLALAVGLATILLRDDIPLPGFLHARIDDALARRGLRATFESAQFDPTGRILLRGLELAPTRFNDAVLRAEFAYVELDRLKLLAGRPDVDRLEAGGVSLICPPSISPSGVAETLLRISTIGARRDDDRWIVDGAIARIGPLLVALSGAAPVFTPAPDAPPPDLDALLRDFARHAPTLVRANPHLERLRDPRLELRFEVRPDRTVALDARLIVPAWHDPAIATLEEVVVDARTTLTGASPGPVELTARVGSIERPGLLRARDVELAATWPGPPDLRHPWPARLDLAARDLAHPRLALTGAIATIHPAGHPEVVAAVRLAIDGEPAALDLRADLETRAGELALAGRFGRTWLATAGTVLGRDLSRYATITEPPDFEVRAAFAPGARWERAELRGLARGLVARGVPLDRARIRGMVTPERVAIGLLELERGDERASGTYEDTFPGRDHRFLFRGAMRPRSISPWFGPWWERFWSDYELAGRPPDFEVDVRSNWLRGHETVVRGRASGEALVVRGHAFNAFSGRFFIRPDHYDIHDAGLVRRVGAISGGILLRYDRGGRIPARQEWNFTSTADLVELAPIFGPGGVALFEPYGYETPPLVEGSAAISHHDGAYATTIDLRIRTPDAFRYHGFPLDALETSVRIRDDRVELPDLRATYAGGALAGSAVAEAGRLTFEGGLEDADFDLAVERFNAFLAAIAADEPEGPSPPPRKLGGRFSLRASGAGPLTAYDAYEGRGEARITGADFARINLLGPVSGVLGSIGIPLGRLELNDAVLPFEIRRERLVFTKARLTGRTGALEGDGSYALRDGSLNFRSRLYPLRESGGALTQFFGALLTPLSNLLELRLTGTLAEPNWSLTRDPLAILREINAQREAEAPAPGPDPEPVPSPAPLPPAP